MEPLGSLVDAVNRIGARNISTLADLTKQPVETVRYRLRKRFPEYGLRVLLHVDYNRLGLRPVFLDIQLSQPAANEPRVFFDKLADVAYLTYFAKEFYRARYLARFGIAVAHESELHHFLSELQESGVLKLFNITPIGWSRRISFNPAYYSFRKRSWSIDWGSIPPCAPIEPMLSVTPDARPDLDKKDVLILKELQLDALQRISEISGKLKISRRVLQYHFQKHVLPLARHHYVRWVGTGDEIRRMVMVEYRFADLNAGEVDWARRVFASFPFTVMEAANDRGVYLAIALVPQQEFTQASRFLGGELGELAEKLSPRLLDMASSLSYTIPHELYAEAEGWQFDREKAMGALLPFLTAALKKRGRAP